MKIGLVPEWPSRPRGVTRAPDRWRAAANVLAARWDMFLHAEAEVPGLRLLLTSPRWTPKRPPRRSWVSSLRSPPDSHDQLVSSAPGRSTNSPVPRLRPVTYAMLGASARQPLQPTARNAGKVRAQPMCGSQRPLRCPLVRPCGGESRAVGRPRCCGVHDRTVARSSLDRPVGRFVQSDDGGVRMRCREPVADRTVPRRGRPA
jgi:hypothetical protein